MQNYQDNKSSPYLISVTTLPCELDNGHVGLLQTQSKLTTAINPSQPSCLRASVQLINDSKKRCSYRYKHNVQIKKKTVLAMTAVRLDALWETTIDATDARKLQWRRDLA